MRAFSTMSTPASLAALRTAASRSAATSAPTSSPRAGVVGVLEVAPDRTGGEQSIDQLLGRQPVAGLEVGRHRHGAHGGDASTGVEGELRPHRVVVGHAERLGDRTARRGQGASSGGLDSSRHWRRPTR